MRTFCLKNPWARAFIPLLLVGIFGVTSNSLVTEISTGNTVNWSLVPGKNSFWVLLAATFLSGWYQIAVSRFDKEVAKGFTPKQYEATIRNRVAEEVAARSKKLIRDGHIEQLEKETETFKRLYGEGNE